MGYWKWLFNSTKATLKWLRELNQNISFIAFVISVLTTIAGTAFALGIAFTLRGVLLNGSILLFIGILIGLISSYYYYVTVSKPKEKLKEKL